MSFASRKPRFSVLGSPAEEAILADPVPNKPLLRH
jgi:hypothetical protein